MFETCTRQEEVNYNINLKTALCWLALHKCITMHGTIKYKVLRIVYLNINQLDALNFIISLFHASTCFEHINVNRHSTFLISLITG